VIDEVRGAGPSAADSPPRAIGRLPRTIRRRLPGGLVLRTATQADIEPLADFNVRLHGDELHRAGTWDELGGGHPTLTLRHQVLVEDPANGAIVSAAYLLPMRWRLASVELPIGQIEAVGTDPAYRRRGLSRRIIEGLHGVAASQGYLLTGIVGVRYLYRRFGYEYAVPLNGFRDQDRSTVPTEPGGVPHVRPARLGDAEALSALRQTWTDQLDLVQVVDVDRFRFDIAGHVPKSFMAVDFSVAVDAADQPNAYARALTGPDDGRASVTEVVLGPACQGSEDPIVRGLAAHVLATIDVAAETLVPGIRWWLGAEHRVYDLLAADLGPLDPPYAWYIRVPDAAALLGALAPVLEARLAASPLAGYEGTLTIDRWLETLRLEISLGRVAKVVSSAPRETDGPRGDLVVPPLLFAQLALGYRTVEELRAIYPDVWRADHSAELLAILFPRLRAWLPTFG
jgi:GNAT superfamily N-acetyltransferase